MRILICFLFIITTAGAAYSKGGPVTYQVDGRAYEGYYTPAVKGGDGPLLLLVHDWDGLTEYEIKRSEMLAGEGYNVFAVDLFGKGVRPTEVKDKKQHTGELYTDRAKMRKLLFAGLDTAVEQGGDSGNTVAFGYCFGGAAVLEMARSGADLKGFVTFHGGLATPDSQDYSKTKGSVMVFHGTADSAISMEEFAALASELEAAGVKHEMVTYSNTPHAFTVFGSERYRPEADNLSWKRFGEYLEATLD